MNTSIVGILYVVATPIGNLQDMTFRAIEVLKKVTVILAEDTRHCKVLLAYYGIQTPVRSLHDHNERAQLKAVLQQLQQGACLALISDAGTPLISDPGYQVVREARLAGITVVPIPGPCAAIAALSASGLATDRFVFVGFLPVKASVRRRYLAELSRECRTLIFYEAPHRVLDVLKEMKPLFGPQRTVVIAREMTKIYETIHSGTLAAVLAWMEQDVNQRRGEIVLLVEAATAFEATPPRPSVEQILAILLKELPVKQAVKLASALTGEKRNKLYKQAVDKLS